MINKGFLKLFKNSEQFVAKLDSFFVDSCVPPLVCHHGFVSPFFPEAQGSHKGCKMGTKNEPHGTHKSTKKQYQ